MAEERQRKFDNLLKKNLKIKENTVAVFGFSREECIAIEDAIYAKKAKLFVAERAKDLIDNKFLAIVIRGDALTDEVLDQFFIFNRQYTVLPYDTVVIGECGEMGDMFITYPDLVAFLRGIDKMLLEVRRMQRSSTPAIHTLYCSLQIYKMICNESGVSTSKIAETMGVSGSTVKRYIAIVNQAGENILYDRSKKGWVMKQDGVCS